MNPIEYESLAALNAPFFPAFEKEFKKVMEKGWYILGENVSSFENEFATWNGSSHCIGLASGLDALIIGLLALDLPAGSEVIVPSNTYIATILSIFKAGLVPVMVEPDPATYNISPREIEKAITSKTKAIIVVHLYGKACEMDLIMNLCKKFDLRLIEDCAQAHGAKFKGKKIGTFGEIGAFSFYPTKNLGALGDAGAITTQSLELADKIRMLRNYGSKVKYYNEVIGMNSRLDEVQAAFLRIKLQALDKINDHKRMLAAIYHQELKDHVKKPVLHNDYFDVYHIYNILHKKRDELKAHLLSLGIKTEIHYPVAPHHQKAMLGKLDGHYPISETIHKETLSLPISFFHTKEDVLRVCQAVNSFHS